MIEPEVTAVQGRRYLALLLDSSLVAATGLWAAYSQSTALTVVGRDAADEPLVDPSEFERMESLLDFELFGQSEILGVNVVRAQEIGDSMRIFGEDSYLWGLIGAVAAALVVFLIIPTLIQRTLGMLPFGLAIRSIDGDKASVGAHLRRSLGGILDAVPIIVPGLLGFLVAGTSAHHQRIGDRIASTVVVDRKLAAFRTPAATETSSERSFAPPATAESTPAPAPATIGASPGSERLDSALDQPVPVADDPLPTPEPEPAEARPIESPTPPAPATSPSVTNPPVAAPAPATVEPAPEQGEMAPPSTVVDASTSRVAAPEQESPPAEAPSATAYDGAPLPPPPVHRKASAATPRRTDLDQPLVDTEADRAATEPFAALRTPKDSPTHAPDVETAPSVETAAESWEPPRVEPAPVWQPTPLDPAPTETFDSSDQRTLEEVTMGNPTVGELISADPVASEAPIDPDQAGGARYGKHSAERQSTTTKTPVWSEKWRAWMYWDGNKKCWLRHDTDSDQWVPVD